MSKKVKRIKIGKKEYSLNDIWRLCRKMWADIKDEPDILRAKEKWLEKHGFEGIAIASDCFFCEWADAQDSFSGCDACPGRMVNPQFNCVEKTYHHWTKPQKFEAEITALDLKRVH